MAFVIDNAVPQGVVTEQGDLGLGFTPLNESEKKTVKKNSKKEKGPKVADAEEE